MFVLLQGEVCLKFLLNLKPFTFNGKFNEMTVERTWSGNTESK